MKYWRMCAFVLAGTFIMACSREDQPEIQPGIPSDNVVTLTTTISRDDENPTRALTESGVKTFQAGDQIAVVYENTEEYYTKEDVTLAAGDITNEGKSARITVTLTNPKTDGVVKYVYPASMAKSDGSGEFWRLFEQQDGTLSKLAREFDFAKFEGTFNGTELPKGTLRNQLAICKFTIKDGDSNDITSQLTRLTIKNGTDVYYINTSSLDNIWVALKPITSGNINIYAAVTWKLYKNAPVVPGALSGLFTINESNDLVYFSQGNLQTSYTSTDKWNNWKFADYQHEFVSKETIKITYPDEGEKIDLFGRSSWTHPAGSNNYGIDESDDESDYYGDFLDWSEVDIKNGGGRNKWHTPSVSELDEILFYRFSEAHVAGIVNARFMRVQLGAAGDNVKGVVIFPDHYVHPTLTNTTITADDINEQSTPGVILHWDDWGKMEAAGAVLLPCAGLREREHVYLRPFGYPAGRYWTSANGNGTYGGQCLEMGKRENGDGDYFFGINTYSRSYGYSVRLIGPGSANQ